MTNIQYIHETIATLENAGLGSAPNVLPCTMDEVVAMESLIPAPYRLPAAYKEFLLYGGKRLARVFKNCDFSYGKTRLLVEGGYQDILSMLRPWAPGASIPPDVFVLNEHLGSNFNFFNLTEGVDPPVYFWEEGEGGLEVATVEQETFSQFLLAQVRLSLSLRPT